MKRSRFKDKARRIVQKGYALSANPQMRESLPAYSKLAICERVKWLLGKANDYSFIYMNESDEYVSKVLL